MNFMEFVGNSHTHHTSNDKYELLIDKIINFRKNVCVTFLNEFSSLSISCYWFPLTLLKKNSTRIAASSQISFMKEKSENVFKNNKNERLLVTRQRQSVKEIVVEACENHARCATEQKIIISPHKSYDVMFEWKKLSDESDKDLVQSTLASHI